MFMNILWTLSKSWRQHPTRHQLYGHLAPITKTIQVRRTRHAGHCWRSRDELMSDVHLWTPTYGRAKAGRPAWTYIYQLCEDTGCGPEDLPEAMNEGERGSGISVPVARHKYDDDDDVYFTYLYHGYVIISWTLVGGVFSYPSAEKLTVYSIAPADWANEIFYLWITYMCM